MGYIGKQAITIYLLQTYLTLMMHVESVCSFVLLHYIQSQQQSYFEYNELLIRFQINNSIAYNYNVTMGNKNEKSEESRTPETIDIKHRKLKKAKFVSSSDEMSDGYLELSQSVNSKQSYQKWKKDIASYRSHKDQIQTIFLPQEVNYQQKGFCGSAGIVKSKYIAIPFVLSEQIQSRRNIKQPFLQKQMWYLLYILTLASGNAHKRGLVLGDINPDNVLMSSQGQICVCCHKSFLNQQKNYYKSLTSKQKTYLSPQQSIQAFEFKNEPESNQILSENFSIGLTLLSAILLQDYKRLYKNIKIDLQQLKSEVNILRNNMSYSVVLKKIIQKLLQVNPQDRLLATDVIKVLKNFEENIINLEQFHVEPQSLDKQACEKLGFQKERKIVSPRSNQFHKVINTVDINQNSRIYFPKSSRNSSNLFQDNNNIAKANSSYFIPDLQIQGNNSSVSQIIDQKLPPSNYINGPHYFPNPNVVIRPQLNVYPPPVSPPQFGNGFSQQRVYIKGPPQYNPMIVHQQAYNQIPKKYNFTEQQRVQSNNTSQVFQYASNINSFIPQQYNQVVSFRKKIQQKYTEEQPQSSNTNPNPNPNPNPNLYPNSKQREQKTLLDRQLYQKTKQSILAGNRQTEKIQFNQNKFGQYDQIMKNIEKTLKESRMLVPD